MNKQQTPQQHLAGHRPTRTHSGRALASRRGLGRTRHIDVADLWAQEEVREDVFEVLKTKNAYNTGGLLTKHLSKAELSRCVEGMGGFFAQGRSEVAPELGGSTDHSMMPILLEAVGSMTYAM